MKCLRCKRDFPQTEFSVSGQGNFSPRCRACNKAKAEADKAAADAAPAAAPAPTPQVFRVGYGPQLFPRHVKLTGLAPADRESARAARSRRERAG